MCIVLVVLLLYTGSFIWVRHTHTKELSYHTEDGVGVRYDCTYFDDYEPLDHLLYVMYYPAIHVDRFLTGREYEKDKW